MLKGAAGIPGDARPQLVLTIGYPDEVVPAPVKYTVENVVFLEGYGNRIKDLNAYLGYTSQHVRTVVAKGKDMLKKVGNILSKKEE